MSSTTTTQEFVRVNQPVRVPVVGPPVFAPPRTLVQPPPMFVQRPVQLTRRQQKMVKRHHRAMRKNAAKQTRRARDARRRADHPVGAFLLMLLLVPLKVLRFLAIVAFFAIVTILVIHGIGLIFGAGRNKRANPQTVAQIRNNPNLAAQAQAQALANLSGPLR